MRHINTYTAFVAYVLIVTALHTSCVGEKHSGLPWCSIVFSCSPARHTYCRITMAARLSSQVDVFAPDQAGAQDIDIRLCGRLTGAAEAAATYEAVLEIWADRPINDEDFLRAFEPLLVIYCISYTLLC